tara:strand:- start:577 stop:1476 length:900 start_codon:yes stop_codon:yes gene_type:complete
MGNRLNLNKNSIIIVKKFSKNDLFKIRPLNNHLIDNFNYMKKKYDSYQEYLYDKNNWWDIKYKFSNIINQSDRINYLLYMFKICKCHKLSDCVFNLSIYIFDKCLLYVVHLHDDRTVLFIYLLLSIIISCKFLEDNIYYSFDDIVLKFNEKINCTSLEIVERNILLILDYRLNLVGIDTLIYYYLELLLIKDKNLYNFKNYNLNNYNLFLKKCIKLSHCILFNTNWINYNLLLLSLSIIIFNYQNENENNYNGNIIKYYYNILDFKDIINYNLFNEEVLNIINFIINIKKESYYSKLNK